LELDHSPRLLGIVTNLARRHRRAEARRWRAIAQTRIAPEPEPMADRVAARVAARGLRADLAAGLTRMPARHRAVLLLIAWTGLDYAETAVALGVPVGTVRSRMHRARKA